MREVLPVAARWARDGRDFAVATVAGVRGSAPRELGASMLVAADGAVFGNVSGGCVEGAVVEACSEALASGTASVHTYGISDDAVVGFGLTCGGIVDVLVRPIPAGSADARQLLALAGTADSPVALALAVSGKETGRAVLVSADAPHDAPWADAAALAADDRARILSYDSDGCRTEAVPAMSMLVIPFGSPPRLIVAGAVEYAVALSRLGSALGYRVTVVDPRDAFATGERFPGADVVIDWPDRFLRRESLDSRSAVCVLSHDPKFDVPALQVALAGPAGYVGAMGSRRTHEDRLARLAEAGVPPARLARLRSPIGLDLGGRSPEETALSILAEIVACRNGATGRPLSERAGPVHARSDMSSSTSISAAAFRSTPTSPSEASPPTSRAAVPVGGRDAPRVSGG